MTKTILGWHFTDGHLLRDMRPVPPAGEWLEHEGPIELCRSGLHASRTPLDACTYAPGLTIHRVMCRDDIVEAEDKIVARSRCILWSLGANTGTRVLYQFGRWCALHVADCWKMPDPVRQYLETGDESRKAAAREAITRITPSSSNDDSASWARTSAHTLAVAGSHRYAFRNAIWFACWAEASRVTDNSPLRSPAWKTAFTAAWASFNDKLTEMLYAAKEE